VIPTSPERQGKEKVETIHPDLDKYLEDTFFLPIYQEQSMRLVSTWPGWACPMANKVRKITAKKQDVTLLAEYKDLFIAGAEPKIGERRPRGCGIPLRKPRRMRSTRVTVRLLHAVLLDGLVEVPLPA
jgi:hypothetical protein